MNDSGQIRRDVIGQTDIQWMITVIFVVKAKNPIVSFLGNQIATMLMLCKSWVNPWEQHAILIVRT
jgi:hypothetical protein